MSKQSARAVEVKDLEKPTAELTSEEAARVGGGIILMKELPLLELAEIQGISFPTAGDSNAGRQTKP